MSILLPYNIYIDAKRKNTYLMNFYSSLKNLNVDIVASHKEWLDKAECFEAVILHWPEGLPRKNCRNDSEFFDLTIDCLNHFKKLSKIFYFVHDLNSHKNFIKKDEKLREYFIKSADAIIHLGHYSKELFCSKYENPERNFVVPHGNYMNLKNQDPFS